MHRRLKHYIAAIRPVLNSYSGQAFSQTTIGIGRFFASASAVCLGGLMMECWLQFNAENPATRVESVHQNEQASNFQSNSCRAFVALPVLRWRTADTTPVAKLLAPDSQKNLFIDIDQTCRLSTTCRRICPAEDDSTILQGLISQSVGSGDSAGRKGVRAKGQSLTLTP